MENKKQVGSSSSFTTDLFGSKESTPPPSSAGTFASIFPPPSTVLGRNSSCLELPGYLQKQSSGNHVWSTEQGTAEIIDKKSEGASNSFTNKERNSIFQERIEPCPLSSSLYYGGQEDMYINSSSTQSSGSYPHIKKDGSVEDDPNGNNSQSASRGNWWQGSLYY